MAIISKDEILKLARISNLEIHDSEIDAIAQQIENVLSYASKVQEIGGKQMGPSTANVNVFRQDVVIPSGAEPIIAQAPTREGRYFVVPSILEHK